MEKVNISKLKPDPNQPRQEFVPAQMERLEKSVQRHGIMQPIAVEPAGDSEYLIIDGERRYRTAQKLGLTDVPIVVYEETDERDRMVRRFQLQEQHASWSPFDKARAIALLHYQTGLDIDQIADAIGMARSAVYDYLLLLNISKRGQQRAQDNKVSYGILRGIGRVLHQFDDGDKRVKVEESLMNRIDNNIIQKANELGSLARAAYSKPDEIYKAITENPTATAPQVLEAAGVQDEEFKSQITSMTRTVKNYLDKAEARGLRFSKDQMASLQSLADAINQYPNV